MKVVYLLSILTLISWEGYSQTKKLEIGHGVFFQLPYSYDMNCQDIDRLYSMDVDQSLVLELISVKKFLNDNIFLNGDLDFTFMRYQVNGMNGDINRQNIDLGLGFSFPLRSNLNVEFGPLISLAHYKNRLRHEYTAQLWDISPVLFSSLNLNVMENIDLSLALKWQSLSLNDEQHNITGNNFIIGLKLVQKIRK